MLKRAMGATLFLKLYLRIRRVTNRCHGLTVLMATLDGVIILCCKTLRRKVGCVLISEIEFQMLKKDIKLQPQVSVKTQDQWQDQFINWTEKTQSTCSEMMNISDMDKKLEFVQINTFLENLLVFIAPSTLQLSVLLFLVNKSLSWVPLELTQTDAGLWTMSTLKTDLKYKVKLSELVSQFS